MAENPQRPVWAFWWPLPFWKVLVIFAATNVVMTFIVVALRELLGLNVPGAAAGGAGGITGYLITMNMAMKARAEKKTDGPA
jgi:hypothetical protein